MNLLSVNTTISLVVCIVGINYTTKLLHLTAGLGNGILEAMSGCKVSTHMEPM